VSGDVEATRRRLADVRARIESAGGDPDRVTVVAVTKGFGPEAIEAALAAGLTDVAENYAQELAAKAAAFGDEPRLRWHFVGRLQRNKVRLAASVVDLWQSVDRPALADEIARRAPGAAVLVQVDTSGDQRRGGAPSADVAMLVAHARSAGLDVRGLMGVAPIGTDAVAREAFATVRRLADELALPVRSMGMSGDLEAAVAEGATMVRVGTALFGPRPPRL
jgi:hypothetical protein